MNISVQSSGMEGGTLILIRHGRSEWNEKNLFTGIHDADLTDQGVDEARSAGERLAALGFQMDFVFTSSLRRAHRTAQLILEAGAKNPAQIPIIADPALNERDYGDLTGLNKDEARKKWGSEQIRIWRRSFDQPPPGGESLKQTAARVLPYFATQIRPRIRSGVTLLVAAHGNSLRALIMALENIPPEQISSLELPTGFPVIYQYTRRDTENPWRPERLSLPG